jgi:methionine-rich copper-binding protein CopC
MMKRRPGVALAVASLAAGLLVFTSGSVFAHSRPVRLDPAPGTVLQSGPAQVQGWFTAAIRRDPNWSFIHVTDAQGNRVDTGDATLSTDRLQMSVALKSGLSPGRYLVNWRTFDDGDGAIFGDCYAFFIGQAAADASVTAKTRLDGGSACQRIDVSAREGTPVPGQTPAAAATSAAAEDGGHEEGATSTDDGGGDIPVWGLVVGIAGGLVVGLVGGRVVGRS